MKILMLHNYYQQKGGEDTVFEAEVSLLQSKGHEVEVCTFHNADIKSIEDRLKVGISSIYSKDSSRLILQKMRAFRPSLLHVHNFFPLASPSIFDTAKRYGIPTIMTVHNFRLICPNALLYRKGNICERCVDKTLPWESIMHGCYRNSRLQSASLALMSAFHKKIGTWKNIDRLICLNNFSRNRLLDSSLNLDPEKVLIKPNFSFDPFLGDIRDRHQEREDFLYIGRLSEEKGIHTLLEAFQKNGLKLKIAGTGPLTSLVEQAALKNNNITYLGFQERPAVLNLLKKSRALILPSIWYENFPMVIVEAFSAGTPVIASSIGGLPDIVENLQNGLLFEPGNFQDLNDKLAQMADPKISQQLGSGARADYEKKYTPEANYEILKNIYAETVTPQSRVVPSFV